VPSPARPVARRFTQSLTRCAWVAERATIAWARARGGVDQPERGSMFFGPNRERLWPAPGTIRRRPARQARRGGAASRVGTGLAREGRERAGEAWPAGKAPGVRRGRCAGTTPGASRGAGRRRVPASGTAGARAAARPPVPAPAANRATVPAPGVATGA
jgi:hypothetical protein